MLVTILSFLNTYVFCINIFVILLIIFYQRRQPVEIYVWVLFLLLVPLTGLFFYILLGKELYREKRFKNKIFDDEEIKKNTINHKIISDQDVRKIIRYNQMISKAPYTENNSVELYFDGIKQYEEIKKTILSAKKYIYLQYYIIRNDWVFKNLVELLITKVQQGVEVYILYDDVGSFRISKSYWKKIKDQGIKVASFFPSIFGPFNIRINYRNHRKIVVVDGNIGFLGGFNIGKEYLGLDKKFGYWRDTHLKIQGDAVTSIEERFIMDWNYTVKDELILKLHKNPNVDYKSRVGIQIIGGGPDNIEPVICNTLIQMIASAKNNIRIQSPYCILDDTVMNALKIAIGSGIKVEFMIANKEDHFMINTASKYYLGQLVERGAKAYLYNTGFLHSKIISIDNKFCSVGTANMDIRSFRLNFEINAFIVDSQVTKKINEQYDIDIRNSIELTSDMINKRSIWTRIGEKIAYLFSPIL